MPVTTADGATPDTRDTLVGRAELIIIEDIIEVDIIEEDWALAMAAKARVRYDCILSIVRRGRMSYEKCQFTLGHTCEAQACCSMVTRVDLRNLSLHVGMHE